MTVPVWTARRCARPRIQRAARVLAVVGRGSDGRGRRALKVAGNRTVFGGGSGRIVGNHAGGAPVFRQASRLWWMRLGGGGEAPSDDAGCEGHHAIARLGLRLGPERAEGGGDSILDVPEVGRVTGRVRFSRFGRGRVPRHSGRRRRSHRTIGGLQLRTGATLP